MPRAAAAEGRKPNILFILADDLGYGDLGCYGQRQIRTPNLDRLAAEGMRFTQCYAGSTVCAPSRCCLMTGLHTGHARVRGNALVPLQPEDVTVAEVLKAAGYATGLVGKWGLGEPGTTGVPNRQGFDEFFGYLNQHHAHNYYPEFLWKNETKYPLAGNVEKDNIATKRVQYSPDLFVREAIGFLDRHEDGPFFLYLAPTLPHANNERGRAEGNGMEVPSDAPYSDRPWPPPQKNHAAMITRLDGDVGKVLDHLRQLGLERDTIVFFSSDNGPHKEGGADPEFFRSSGPLRGFKRAMYDGGIRVPMIVRWPDHVPAGTTSEQIWAFWDFLPTAAELAGTSAPGGLDGLSIVPTLLGQGTQPQHDFLYWEFHEGGFKQAVRTGDWKAVRLAPGKPLELYDLKTDPGETRNIADQHPDVIASIEAYLRRARTDSPDFPVQAPTPKGRR
ncbi:MAG: arylsulfatase [Isosphaeraceae bacterium]|nr:arylsulfatase [Isosphaeraceae bacterium]